MRRGSFKRLARTVVLGTGALTAVILWLGDQYGIEREVILDFLLSSALFIGLLIALGLTGAFVLLAVKRLTKRSD